MSAADEISRSCALLLGIPLSQKDFLHDLERDGQEYAQIFLEGLHGATPAAAALRYQRIVIEPALAICQALESWGVTVVRKADLASITPAFLNHSTVGLLAHARDFGIARDAVFVDDTAWVAQPCFELSDGPASVAEIAEAIPEGWQGFGDLMACGATAYALALKRRRPGSHYVVNSRRTDPIFRLRAFHASVGCMRHHPETPYADALVAAIRAASAQQKPS